MNTSFLDSKSMQLWLLIFGAALITIFLSAGYFYATGREPPFVREFFGLLGVGGGTGTVRNVMVDGPTRLAQANTMPGAPAA